MYRKGPPYSWGNANILWNDNPYTWDDVYLILNILGGNNLDYLEKYPAEKKKFIKLLCKVQGVEYKESKEVEKTQIFITDIDLVAKEVAGIILNVEL